MSRKTGQCLCGAVRVTVRNMPLRMEACHCATCRRWTGGAPYLGVAVARADVLFTGEDDIGIYRSSGWAERGFCRRCGAHLFFRMAGAALTDNLSLCPGILDDVSGIVLTQEMFIDQKPDVYDLTGERPRITRAEALALLDEHLERKGMERTSDHD
ncbi:MAG: GFA family protein [Pseudomonadota bacterium]